MTGLLPDVVREAIDAKSTNAMTASFGLVALIALLVLLIGREALGGREIRRERDIAFKAVVGPLLVVVVLVMGVRLAWVFP
jgi:hypothetical protein